MAKAIASKTVTRTSLAAGVHELASVVKVTLGPKGRYVAFTPNDLTKEQALQESGDPLKTHKGTPTLTNDGAMVAAHIEPADSLANLGLKVIREAALGTNLSAGDGTTTATVLADALVSEGMKLLAAGADPLALRRGITYATNLVIEALRAQAHPVETVEQMAEVATVSSGSPVIGAKIAEALNEIGKDGIISVEKSKKMGIDIEIQKGLMFDHGLMSPDMADDFGRLTAELVQPYIFITDERLADNFEEILPMLEEVQKSGHPLLVVADDVRGLALQSLLMNRRKGTIKSVCVQTPGFKDGDRRKTETEDLAILTGGTFFTAEKGLSIKDASKALLGRANTAIITKDRTVIIGGKGKKEAIEARCNSLRQQIDGSNSGYDQDVLRERLAKLSGGIAVMKVGAPTESEMEETRSRIQDALLATRAAAREGLLPGGGIAYLNATSVLQPLLESENTAKAHPEKDLSSEEIQGVALVAKALEVPLKTLAENSGLAPEVVLEKVRSLPAGEGLNCADGTFGPMIARGIADPAQVSISALETAASVAGMILITEVGITEA